MTTTDVRTDDEIKKDVVAELDWVPSVDCTHVGVSVNGGAVELSGEVNTYPEKLEAERSALRIRGVRALANEIVVRGGWSTTIADVDIARAAGEALDRSVEVPASVSAVVRDHVVTISGTVEWDHQREAAAKAVRTLTGVQHVVNLVHVEPTLSIEAVESAIGAALVRNALLERRKIDVKSGPGGNVVLTGTVQSWTERHEAERAAWSAPGVTSVTNDLRVA